MTNEAPAAELWRVEWDQRAEKSGGWTVYRYATDGRTLEEDSNHARKTIADARAAELNQHGGDEQPNPLEQHGASVDVDRRRGGDRRGMHDAIGRSLDELEHEQPTDRVAVWTVSDAIAADLERLGELEELADLSARFLHPIAENAGRRFERMQGRPGTRPEKLEDARQELEQARRALELARKHSPKRRAVLAKALPNG